ncbi:transcription factor FapR [Desulfosporosinus hippei]|uniref:Acyl-coenzyme A thioesterase PaaI, contains HGG motif n=1 Tax=Desulfosporosinus hippei DSM 8344 TaxID=1121419 RepID=A0A1G7RGF8_9FIRM|nr:transcription factor FapR [Desulfosporosinus hippei]SDG09858.1 Acyl-coenzyme A thioesterase PaaI, contains HGG motif [Desulfosporosinus hippei DSM 8344]
MARYSKEERRKLLKEALAENPFFTDEELSERFIVSVSTIRLDRGELGIPEVRERTRAVAQEAYSTLKSLDDQELIGELMELVIGERACSKLVVDESMVLTKARVARGHYLFAQANSLAIALVDAKMALTGSVELKFIRPVQLGEVVLAKGVVLKRKLNKYWVEIRLSVGAEDVLCGNWVLFAIEDPAGIRGEME